MGEYLSTFFTLLFCSVVPLLACGLAMWLFRWLYVTLCGELSGRPLILAASILSTPLREIGHAIACILFFHRIEQLRLFNPRDPDGELGFVEHSYNPRNPIALLGNFVYAMMPVIVGLAAVALICLGCFRGVLGSFLDQITALGESEAGFLAYVSATRSFVPMLLGGGESGVFSKIVGISLLLALCLGIYLTPTDLKDAFSGALIYVGLCAVAALVVAFLDRRITRIVCGAMTTFATAVTALALVTFLAAAAMLLVAGVFFLIRGILGLDMRNDPPAR